VGVAVGTHNYSSTNFKSNRAIALADWRRSLSA
jgi:hypothetical protein